MQWTVLAWLAASLCASAALLVLLWSSGALQQLPLVVAAVPLRHEGNGRSGTA